MLSESVHHLAHPSVIVLTTKFVSMRNVCPDVPGATNVLNSMNAEEVSVLWLKNVGPMMIVMLQNLVPLLSPPLANGNARMSVQDLSSVEEMLCVKQIIIGPFALVPRVSLVIQRMTRLDAKRNCVPPTQTALETTFVWTLDVLRPSELLVQPIESVELQKSVPTETVSIPVPIKDPVESMLSAQSTTTTSNVSVPKASLAMLKLNVFVCPTLVFQLKDVQVE